MKLSLWLRAGAAIAFVCVLMLFAASAVAQDTTVTASHLGGNPPVPSATVYFQPMSGPTGGVAAARRGTSGGQILGVPIQATATAGVLSVTVPDANATTPAICYAYTAIDPFGTVIQGAGLAADGVHVNPGGAYGCIQPTGSTWDFDSFIPGSANAQGTPLLNWRGVWSSATAYAAGDSVSYQGSSYANTLPGNTNTPGGMGWSVLASAGAPGPNCATGSPAGTCDLGTNTLKAGAVVAGASLAVTGGTNSVTVLDPNGNGQTCNVSLQTQTTTCSYNPLWVIPSGGQSLSIGSPGTGSVGSPLSTTQPYGNLTLTGGVKGLTGPFIPLIEGTPSDQQYGPVETPSAGMANYLAALLTPSVPSARFAVALHGQGGTAIANLMRGTQPYTNGQTQVSAFRLYGQRANYATKSVAMRWSQGETDYSADGATINTAAVAAYCSNLLTLQGQYLTDIRAQNSSVYNLPLFFRQVNQGWTGDLANNMLQCAVANPGTLYMYSPSYQHQFQSSDHLHLASTTQYKWDGEYSAKWMWKILCPTFGGTSCPTIANSGLPLYSTGAALSGSTITLSYAIPAGSLQFRTTEVVQHTNQGFAFVQTGGNSPTISSVSLASGNTQVQVNLSVAPTGANMYLHYGTDASGCSGTWCGGGATDSTKVGGNLADTDCAAASYTGSTGLALCDYAALQYIPVPSVPAAPTNVAQFPQSNAGSISFTPGASGFAITGDSASCTDGTNNFSNTGSTSPIVVSGLTNGTTYTCSAKSSNTYGTSAASSTVSLIPGSVPTPVWYMAFNGNYNDSSGNGHNGTAGALGGCTFISDPTGVHNAGGSVCSLPGTTNWDAVNGSSAPSGSWSYSSWVYNSSSQVAGPYAVVGAFQGTNYSYWFGKCGTTACGNAAGSQNLWMVSVGNQGAAPGSTHLAMTCSAPTANTWYNLAVTYDSTNGQTTAYINGTQCNQQTFASFASTATPTQIQIGAYTSSFAFMGNLSGVRYWNSVLTAAQVATVASQNN
jgi:hypothetical protein